MKRDKMYRGCENDEVAVCDFCLHFLFYRTREGHNIDGSGWCGLHRKETDAGHGCEDYYCKAQWIKDVTPKSEDDAAL